MASNHPSKQFLTIALKNREKSVVKHSSEKHFLFLISSICQQSFVQNCLRKIFLFLACAKHLEFKFYADFSFSKDSSALKIDIYGKYIATNTKTCYVSKNKKTK